MPVNNLKHGHTTWKGNATSTYNIWRAMLSRCRNQNAQAYKHYGARGITVTKRWHDFRNFLEDMGVRPEGKSIDRINNSLGYSKKNCRWASMTEQQNNRRDNVFFVFAGKKQTLKQHCRDLDINYQTSWDRINKQGWSIERVFSTPTNTKFKEYWQK